MKHSARSAVLLFALGVAACGSGSQERADDATVEPTIGGPQSSSTLAAADVSTPTTSLVPRSTVRSTSPSVDGVGVPLGAVVEVGADQWVVPAWIPEGMSLQFLAAQGRTVSVGAPEWPGGEISIHIGPGIGNQDPDATTGADGWIVDAGTADWSATRRHRTDSVFVSGSGLAQPFDQRFLDRLRVVDEIDLPIEPLDIGSPHHRVATSESGEASMSVAGGNLGWYSVEVSDVTSSSAGGPEHFDRAGKVAVLQGGFGYADGDVAIRVQPHGFTTPDVALVDVDLVDGQTVTVVPVDDSDRYEDRFWVLDVEIPVSMLGDRVDSGLFVIEARAVDHNGNIIGQWRHDDPPFEFPHPPVPDPGPIRMPNELVVLRRVPTADERERLDNSPPLLCELASGGQVDYEAIGPNDPQGRVSDDALRDAIDSINADTDGNATRPSLETEGWTELLLGPGDSTFVYTIDDWRAIVTVGGDPDIGVWRYFTHLVCAD